MLKLLKMTEADISQVAEIEKSVFSQPWSMESFQETLHQDNVYFVVAKQQEEVLGYCGLYMAADEGEITNVAVKKEARRQGIADQMMEYLMKVGQKYHLCHYYLEVRVSNTGAIELYKKHGFSCDGIRKGFYERPKEDAYVMSHHLISI